VRLAACRDILDRAGLARLAHDSGETLDPSVSADIDRRNDLKETLN
jgi:hypothetical protein